MFKVKKYNPNNAFRTAIYLDFFPFTVKSEPFCNIEIGEVFQVDNSEYRLLERNAFKVRVVRWFKLYSWIYKLLGREVARSTGAVRE